MDLAEIERRLTRVEDIEAIKQLKARYCEICDDAHDPDRITSVFAEDGIWESADFGVAKGHAEIRKLFQKFQQLIEFSQHNVMNPIIEVSGDRATGEWYFMGPFTFREGNQTRWLALQYKDDYVKRNGQWKYQGLNGYQTFYTSYEAGWGKQSNPLMNYFPGYPPDLPHSIEYEPYPAVFVPPFHYKNPVSGR